MLYLLVNLQVASESDLRVVINLVDLPAEGQVALLEIKFRCLIEVKAHMIPWECVMLHSYRVKDRVVWELLD